MESIRQAQKVITPGEKSSGYNRKFNNRYGRLDQKIPESITEKAILDSIEQDFKDGKITENVYLRKKILAQGKVASLLWIATTNNMGKSPYPKLSGRPVRNRSR